MRVAAALAVLAVTLSTSAQAATADARQDVVFEVTNLGDGGAYDLHGFRMDPDCAATSVVVLQHGLSYTSEAWDVPGYSVARTLVDAGYAVVAFDRLGYGRSVLDDGRAVNTFAYHDMAHQVVLALGRQFDQVVIGGHSAGGEASIGEASVYGDVDALVVMGYHHYPSSQIVQDFFTGDIPRALADDYEYFLGTPEHRAEMFYTEHADPLVVAQDTDAAVLTPSGEILSIGPQPSRYVHTLTLAEPVPVFLQMASQDRLFPLDWTSTDEAPATDLRPILPLTYANATSVTLDEVPDAGHTFMLHPTGPPAAARLASWLDEVAGIEPCGQAGSDGQAPSGQPDADTGPELPVTGGGAVLAALAALAAWRTLRPRWQRPGNS